MEVEEGDTYVFVSYIWHFVSEGQRSNDGSLGGCLFILAGKKLLNGNGVHTMEFTRTSYDGVLYLRCTDKTDILRIV